MLGHWYMMGEPTFGRMKPGQTIPFVLNANELGRNHGTNLSPVISLISAHRTWSRYSWAGASSRCSLWILRSTNSFITRSTSTIFLCTFHFFSRSLAASAWSCYLSLITWITYYSTIALWLFLCELCLPWDEHLNDSADSIRTGYLVSAAVICIDYFYLRLSHRVNKRLLMASFVIKFSFVIVELGFIVAFRVIAAGGNVQSDTAAVLEWGMCLPLRITIEVANGRQSLHLPLLVICFRSLLISYLLVRNLQSGMSINSWRWAWDHLDWWFDWRYIPFL